MFSSQDYNKETIFAILKPLPYIIEKNSKIKKAL